MDPNMVKLYLFGDQTYDVGPHLKSLLLESHHGNVLMTDFFHRCYNALRAEIYRLPFQERESLPRFTSIEDIILWRTTSPDEARHCVPLDMSLTCIYHIAAFISQVKHAYPSPQKCRVLGLCTGTLAAAAISCAQSLEDLIPTAVIAMIVAFRTGVAAASGGKRATSLGQSDTSSGFSRSWSLVAAGPAASQAVKNFGEQSALPLTARPFISAHALHGITVTGPPSSLAKLTASEEFTKIKYKDIPIFAPYHANLLFSQEDIREVLKGASGPELTSLAKIPVLSPSSGQILQAEDFQSLLQAAVKGILLQEINWTQILSGIQAAFEDFEGLQLEVAPIGTAADQLIHTGLKQTPLGRSLLTLPPGSKPSFKQEPSFSPSPPRSYSAPGKRSKIAIIGMSGRFPGANSTEAFWDLLSEGLDVHKEVPPLHWNKSTHFDPTGRGKNTSATPYGCWLDDPAAFDARFFNVSPREAPQIDPAQRIALMTAYEAIEQAGIVPDATPSTRRDRVGVFYGVTSNDWMETNSAQKIDTYFIPGGNRAFIPGRINYFFKFSGPSYAIDTACSSSLAAIHTACNSLWAGDIDTAITGGTNVLTNPDFTAGLDRGYFLSRTGNCKTFDDAADGYCRGEGVGTVILKRLDDAVADNDPILGLILGAYTNHSAEADSITRPHSGAQRAMFNKILHSTQDVVDPTSISYIEMHGTGTQAGDASEMQSVLDTFAPAVGVRNNKQPLFLGSAKANIGHGEAASGVSSLIKIMLMMRENMIPPHCGIKSKINHKFPTDLTERNVRIARDGPVSWQRSISEPRRVFVNNFSAAGGNTALLIEDAPHSDEMDAIGEKDTRTTHLVAISAKNAASLQGNLNSMLRFIDQRPAASISDLSYTTTARRIHHPHRVMLATSSFDDLHLQIQSAIRDQAGANRPKVHKMVFAFTGQGAQFAGMGKVYLHNFSVFRTEIYRLDHLGQCLGFPSVIPVFEADESENILESSPVAVQLASICMQIALTKLLSSWNISPTAVVGHSLGEFAALNAAGVLSDADTIYLVGKRAEMIQEKCSQGTHSMLVVRGSVGEIEAALRMAETKYEFACVNSPSETVLAGKTADMDKVAEVLARSRIRTTILKVPYAFHSSQVEPILEDFATLAEGATFSGPRVPVICPSTGVVASPTDVDLVFCGKYLAQHCREPVNMLKALNTAHDDRVITSETVVLEVGPHPAISAMVKATLGSQITTLPMSQRTSSSKQSKSPWQVLTETLRRLYCVGTDIRWTEYHRDFASAHKVVPLPAYSWDLKDYWIQYVNDWSLRKGDPPLLIGDFTTSRLDSTTIHRVVRETPGPTENNLSLVVEADIARPDLNPLVQGHMVDNIPLCTPSVYADIALTLGKYLVEKYQPQLCNEQLVVDVSDMTISKALIAKPKGPQPFQAQTEVDWRAKEAACKFVSFDSKGQPQEHARCVIRFQDRAYQQKLQKDSVRIMEKMQALRKGIAAETTARFNRAMVYRMIRPLAQFHADYRAIDEFVLDSHTLEASSRVSFGSVKRNKDDRFHTHPAIIDALTQSCGFVMNCNDGCDLDVEVFMNHGWGSFQIYEEIQFGKAYTTYTRMHEGKDRLWHGDVAVFDGDTVVASFQQLAIQGVPRRVLQVILSLESGKKAQKPQLTSSAGPAALAPTSTATQVRPSKVSSALQIISEESGISVSDLTDSSLFSDLGVDSLLSLTITARFREELDVDIDSTSMVMEFPSIGDLKKLFKAEENEIMPYPDFNRPSEDIRNPSVGRDLVVAPSSNVVERALHIISEESGVAKSDLTDDTHFTDSGIDSLLSLVIVSRFRDELELEIDHESLLMECPTVADLKLYLLGGGSTPSDQESTDHTRSPSDSSNTPSSPASDPEEDDELIEVKPEDLSPESRILDRSSLPEAVATAKSTSLIIQGSQRTCTKTLFLFPDGSGSATSYAGIPRISPDTCVVAFNSPFLKDPESLRACPLDHLIEVYLTELRRRQPSGPYHLGGWSAGGVLAYRMAQSLGMQGEEVASLTLIDSPLPLNGLDRLPKHFYDFCRSLHLFGGGQHGKPASSRQHTHTFTDAEHDKLISHFNASIDVLHEYHATPLRREKCPKKVSIIWAPDTVTDRPGVKKMEPHPDDTEGMKFLTERRTDFGANGWDKLFPSKNCEINIRRVEDAHHFSMMREPYAAELAAHIRENLI
ncbi:hypothetical protein J7T55_010867 [Diaporthe amygdali]|uniref:uncharacterized protein n=1 Tax=Phomopsis amygdali TaxID=1214568 RepID=UPI0022FF1FD8|nr:uncharacterized protein J7T55_010867 [Diaporthe amygdali]KAJ0104403.1 hypothetical protein J7T55_010867 [Diaporthe amygdali]